MPYLRGPYQQFTSLPAPTTTTVVNARRVDFNSGQYEIDDDGNAVGMDPTAQRVMLAVSFGSGEPAKFVTDRDMDARRARIEAALSGLVTEGAIRLLSVTVQPGPVAGETAEVVRYVNLQTQQEQSVEL